MSIQFPNGSRLVGLPGSEATVRGFSAVTLMMVDEAARVADDLYLAVRPMLLVSKGSLWLMSTPWGRRGFFYNTWTKGGPEWEKVRVTAEECPRIDRALLEQERAVYGERWFTLGLTSGGAYEVAMVSPAGRISADAVRTTIHAGDNGQNRISGSWRVSQYRCSRMAV